VVSGFIVTGGKEMQRKLEKAAADLKKRQMTALRQEAEIEMTESKKRCPVYSPRVGDYVDHVGGTLRASGHVQPVEQRGGKTSVNLVYGGAAEDYAVVQHEELGYHHNVGQAKYLESVLMESLPHMGARIAARMKENLK
jgi:hypothetical protein